jgi:hypothetical protein
MMRAIYGLLLTAVMFGSVVGGEIFRGTPPYVGHTYVMEVKNTVGTRGTYTANIKFGDATTIKPNPKPSRLSIQGNTVELPYIIPFQFWLEPPHPCLPNGYAGYGDIHYTGGFSFGSEMTFWNSKKSFWNAGIGTKFSGYCHIKYYPPAGGTNLKLNFDSGRSSKIWKLKTIGNIPVEDVPKKDRSNTLTREQAANLVASNKGKYLYLTKLTSIDKDVASELAKHEPPKTGGIYLRGLNSINKDVAHELAKYKGKLYLEGLTSIDKDVASELAKHEPEYEHSGIFFKGFSSLDKDVAQELAKYKACLHLEGLTAIDKPIAQELANFKGTGLYLEGLNSINIDLAKELAKIKVRILRLRGPTSISKNIAQELAKLEASILELRGLASIDKDVAQELAKFKRRLTLFGLTSIDRDVAQELAKLQGGFLELGLTSIDKEVAQELAKFKGYQLFLPRLTSIDQEVAHEFANYKGFALSLTGLVSIGEDKLNILTQNKKIIYGEKFERFNN